MSPLVLTEYQGACRAAHQQVQLLLDLYERLVERREWRDAPEYGSSDRCRELGEFRAVLREALAREALLPTRPDPEKEELMEFAAEARDAIGAGGHRAVTERLLSEEYGLLRLAERLQAHRASPGIEHGLEATRAAVARLEAAAN